ncbi:MAG: NADH-quinone oxidoreductase subunit NuoF [Acidimicrobiia bacterium]|nr:NADH-quinone oxidoreductase subunit NuoF [Acidimicrobiia bacterium]
MAVTEAPRIVTSRFAYDDSHTLDRFLATGGYAGLRAAMAMEPGAVTDIVKAAIVRGRGGAGFPAGDKWGFLPEGVFPRYLVVNGDESEPGTCKDRPLMERDPHQLIEGAVICSYAIKADRAFLYVRGEMALAQERLVTALAEAYRAGYLGRDILGSGYDLDIVLHWGAGAYIVGDETALLESLEGKRGMPRLKPPYFPAAKGLYLQPTVVNNVETLSNLGWIMRQGAEAFAALGEGRATGTRVHCLSGHVKRPGNYEVELHHTTIRDLIYDPVYGNGIRDDHALKAFIPGGASAPWFYPEQLDLPLDPDEVSRQGSMLGSGAVVVMDETTCMVRAAWRLVRFFAHESCGKCTPCREGASWLEKILARIEAGAGREEDLDLLLDIGDNISPGPFPRPAGRDGETPVAFPYRRTTICDLGPSAVSPVFSSVWRFRDEFLTHVKDGGCPFR